MPSILADSMDYLGQAALGRLPEGLFDSTQMIAYIGYAADRNGHEFNRKVAQRLNTLHWKAKQELSLAQFGGGPELGDIDVLAWRPEFGLIYAIECKSLRFDRTVGEIGERLAEYTAGTVAGKRTPLQKHLDRIAYLQTNPEPLSQLTGIPAERLQVRSALITEKLVPMQFSGETRELLDLVTDFELLEQELETAFP